LRLTYHNIIEKGYTSRYRPWEIIYTKQYSSKREAAEAERKSWRSAKMIERLLKGEIEL
jgi:putative endonuclease